MRFPRSQVVLGNALSRQLHPSTFPTYNLGTRESHTVLRVGHPELVGGSLRVAEEIGVPKIKIFAHGFAEDRDVPRNDFKRHVNFTDLPWDNTLIRQSYGRAHRQGVGENQAQHANSRCSCVELAHKSSLRPRGCFPSRGFAQQEAGSRRPPGDGLGGLEHQH